MESAKNRTLMNQINNIDLEAMAKMSGAVLGAARNLKPGEQTTIECPECGGVMRVMRVECNGHVRGYCEECESRVME